MKTKRLSDIPAGTIFRTSRMTSPSNICDCGGVFQRTVAGAMMVLNNCKGKVHCGEERALEPETTVRDFEEVKRE